MMVATYKRYSPQGKRLYPQGARKASLLAAAEPRGIQPFDSTSTRTPDPHRNAAAALLARRNKTTANPFSLGVFQGRLSSRGQRTIQFFPFDNWENEFPAASEIGLDEIEFIFDFERYQENPLWTPKGREKINRLKKESAVAINHICADFFMARPFFRVPVKNRKENISTLNQLIEAAAAIGAQNIEIPLVDNSSIKNKEEENILIDALGQCLPTAGKCNVTIGLETDLPPGKFLSLLKKFNSPVIKANYDSGNSAGLGYDHREEIMTLSSYIANVHIKDRLLRGTTVPLGTGNANFDKFFGALKEINYRGSLILQVARGDDGKEKETVAKQITFIKRYINM